MKANLSDSLAIFSSFAWAFICWTSIESGLRRLMYSSWFPMHNARMRLLMRRREAKKTKSYAKVKITYLSQEHFGMKSANSNAWIQTMQTRNRIHLDEHSYKQLVIEIWQDNKTKNAAWTLQTNYKYKKRTLIHLPELFCQWV